MENCDQGWFNQIFMSNPWAAVAVLVVLGATVVGIIWAANR
jgi:hypothetical protein